MGGFDGKLLIDHQPNLFRKLKEAERVYTVRLSGCVGIA
jgi:hypothetical protein